MPKETDLAPIRSSAAEYGAVGGSDQVNNLLWRLSKGRAIKWQKI